MFAIANVLVLLISAVNLFAMASGKSPTVPDIARELGGVPGGRERLKSALWFSGLLHAYLISWVFPLKALHFHLGLAWAWLMLFSVLESIHTGRKLWAAVGAEGAEVSFTLHASWAYRAYQLLFHGAVLGACAFLLWPR